MNQPKNMKFGVQPAIEKHRYIIIAMCAVLLALELANVATERSLNSMCLIPGSEPWHMLSMHFIHADFFHFAVNTVMFFLFATSLNKLGTACLLLTTCVAMATSGLGIWFVGEPNSCHLGASGVVYGFWGFLVFSYVLNGLYKPAMIDGAIALGFNIFLADILSWEGHLFGFIGGVAVAWFYRHRVTMQAD